MNNRRYDSRGPDFHGNIAGVFGLWRRAREERDSFGKVRTMTADGLERNAGSEAHTPRVEELTGAEIRR